LTYLLNVLQNPKGYEMTAYSDREEKVNEFMWRDRVPFYVEEALR